MKFTSSRFDLSILIARVKPSACVAVFSLSWSTFHPAQMIVSMRMVHILGIEAEELATTQNRNSN
jgi:hypothetical protein